jgi:hypothetical protein
MKNIKQGRIGHSTFMPHPILLGSISISQGTLETRYNFLVKVVWKKSK